MPPPRGGGEPGTLAFWWFLLFQWCLPLCASEPEPPPREGGEPRRTLAGGGKAVVGMWTSKAFVATLLWWTPDCGRGLERGARSRYEIALRASIPIPPYVLNFTSGEWALFFGAL